MQSLYINVDGVEYKYSNPRGGYLLYLATSEQMQEFDKFTIHTLRVPAIVLMDHAGFAVAQKVAELRPKKVVVVCGKGNNGGDGWVAARWLKHWGQCQVEVISSADPNTLSGEAKLASEMALAAGVPYQVYYNDLELKEADVYVDALLGTGAARPLKGDLARLVEAVNRAAVTVVAVDVPSGVDASTGEVFGTAIKAQHTVCLGLQKLGTAVTPGCYSAGQVTVADIGIPVQTAENLAVLTEAKDLRNWLPKRDWSAHKGTFGRVGIVMGEMQGAAVLAGLGAARSGAGLVILGRQANRRAANPNGANRSEVNQSEASWSAGAAMEIPYEFVLRERDRQDDVLDGFNDCQAVVVGPGLGRAAETPAEAKRWQSALHAYRGTGVLDADGLRFLADDLALLETGHWVLTPHPKECGRLLGWTTDEVQQKRVLAARTLADLTSAVVVLKGYHSLIAAPGKRLSVNPTGDASLSTAGTGDVLAGLIGSLLAQGLEPFDAARAGAYLHGLAGELAGKQWNRAGTMASDVVNHIPYAMNEVLQSFPGD